MSDIDPYTSDELDADVIGWVYAVAENRSGQAFTTLLNCAAAVAQATQNVVLIEALREIRPLRDGGVL